MNCIKLARILFVVMTILCAVTQPATAAEIWLKPSDANVGLGSNFDVAVFADIGFGEEIIGFGFDADISGTGSAALTGFDPGPLWGLDPYHVMLSDSDGILGASSGDLFFGPAQSGDKLWLGSMHFTVTGLGIINIALSADDLSEWYTEGLIFADPDLNNKMPKVASVSVNVPEPATILLFGAGLFGIGIFRKKAKTY